MSHVIVRDGHWMWTGDVNPSGYGRGGHSYLAHRKAYELFVGCIPDGLHLDHLCGVRLCVNPEHLEPVTLAENNRRKGKGRSLSMVITQIEMFS